MEAIVPIVLRDGGRVPCYQTPGSAGADLHALLDQPLVCNPGQRICVPTGVSIALDEGFEAQVRPRSGLALRHGLTLLNSPGTIDSDYRGEIQVQVINLGESPVTISNGDRIAQLVVMPVARARFMRVDHLEESERGAGGFGHTGL